MYVYVYILLYLYDNIYVYISIFISRMTSEFHSLGLHFDVVNYKLCETLSNLLNYHCLSTRKDNNGSVSAGEEMIVKAKWISL